MDRPDQSALLAICQELVCVLDRHGEAVDGIDPEDIACNDDQVVVAGIAWRGGLALPIRAILRGDGRPTYEICFADRSFVAQPGNGRILDELAKNLRAYLHHSDPHSLDPICVDLVWLAPAEMPVEIDSIHVCWQIPFVPVPNGLQFYGAACSFSCEMEPFFASLRLTSDHSSMAYYEIRIGDGIQGLQKRPGGKLIRNTDWYRPASWLYTFAESF